MVPQGYGDEIRELHQAGVRITNGYALSAMLSQAYDMKFGIYNHNQPNVHPLAPVLVHDAEKLDYLSPKRRMLKRYRAASVLKHTGIPFDRFLQLTHMEVEDILEECMEADKAEFSIAEEVEDQMRKTAAGQTKK